MSFDKLPLNVFPSICIINCVFSLISDNDSFLKDVSSVSFPLLLSTFLTVVYAGVDSQDNPKDFFNIFKCDEIYIAIFLNVSALEQIAKIENNKTRDSSYPLLLSIH